VQATGENRMAAAAGAAPRLRPLEGGLGAEVLDLAVADVDAGNFPAIYDAFLKHQLLLFRDQDLPPAAQVAFARRFGEVQVHVMSQYHASAYPELYTLSNLDAAGKPRGEHPDRGTMAWHTDGGTGFADMYSAYDSLDPAEQEKLATMRAVHNLNFSRNRRHGESPMSEAQRNAVPPVDHPIVRTHPETGRKCLFLGDHAESIVGMAYDEGRDFVEALNERIIASSRIYTHRWRKGDLMVWDNRCLMHKAESYDTAREARVIRRCTVLGEVPR
jgi:taurine dioxygenase